MRPIPNCWSRCRSSRPARRWALLALAPGLTAWPVLPAPANGLHTLETGSPIAVEATPMADDVGDPLLAFLVGVLDVDAYGRVQPALLDSVVTAGGGSKLPYEHIQTLERRPVEARSVKSDVEVHLTKPVNLGVPYSILGYHPGSVRAPEHVILREWRIRRYAVRWVDGEQSREDEFRDIRLFSLEEGRVEMDVDWWLDKLLGPKLDDTHMVGFALTTHEGKRYAVAFGYTKSGKGRSGCFDLEMDEIVFPAPKKFLHLGREMRSRVERLSKAAR